MEGLFGRGIRLGRIRRIMENRAGTEGGDFFFNQITTRIVRTLTDKKHGLAQQRRMPSAALSL